jgi:hypothetical protein
MDQRFSFFIATRLPLRPITLPMLLLAMTWGGGDWDWFYLGIYPCVLGILFDKGTAWRYFIAH